MQNNAGPEYMVLRSCSADIAQGGLTLVHMAKYVYWDCLKRCCSISDFQSSAGCGAINIECIVCPL